MLVLKTEPGWFLWDHIHIFPMSHCSKLCWVQSSLVPEQGSHGTGHQGLLHVLLQVPDLSLEAAHSCHQQGKSKCGGGNLHAVRGGFHRFLLLSHPQDAHLKRNKYCAWWLLQVKPAQKLLAAKIKYTSSAASHSTSSHLFMWIYGSFFFLLHMEKYYINLLLCWRRGELGIFYFFLANKASMITVFSLLYPPTVHPFTYQRSVLIKLFSINPHM